MHKKAHVIHPADNVAVAVAPIGAGERIKVERDGGEVIEAAEDIEFGHKLALEDLAPGDLVVKYGEVIGRATKRIVKGAHVHVHNLESMRGRGDLGK